MHVDVRQVREISMQGGQDTDKDESYWLVTNVLGDLTANGNSNF